MNLKANLDNFGELVKFSHTIFLFPFAMSAVVLANQVKPIGFMVFVWVVVCLVAARSAAMIMNRIADHDIDSVNPRTKGRPMPSGRVSRAQAWAWMLLAIAVFLFGAWRLGPLPLALSPLALVMILGYSFTKRFTMLCHIWLGAATSLAPLGAWIAVTGGFDARILVLAISTTLWVAGFDIIYACQDISFDRSHKLNSIPARLGVEKALMVSRIMHLVAALGFFALAPLFGLGKIYLWGAALVAAALAIEQFLVWRRLANVPMAFFTVNGVISVLFFCFLWADILLR